MNSRETIETILKQHQQLFQHHTQSSEHLIPHDYATLVQVSLLEEYREELAFVNSLIETCETHQAFLEAITKQCAARYERTENTCLSMAANPNSPSNTLYWELVIAIYQPKTMQHMLSIIAPKVTTLLTFDVKLKHAPTLFFTPTEKRTAFKDLLLVPTLEPLNSLTMPPTRDFFKQAIIADHTIVLIGHIAHLTIELQLQLSKYLDQNYPKLIPFIYSHNDFFKELHRDIELLTNKGVTPQSAITNLISALQLAGERMTGRAFAESGAVIALVHFKQFLDSIPAPAKDALLKLQNKDKQKSLADVLNDLDRGNCVETAANDLQHILDHAENHDLLLQRPQLSKQDAETIQKKYPPKHVNESLLTMGQNPNTAIPTTLLVSTLSQIHVENTYDFISLLLSFPPALYSSLLAHTKLPHEPTLPPQFFDVIAGTLFSTEQKTHIHHAIADNADRLGGASMLIDIAMRAGNHGLLIAMIQSLKCNANVLLMPISSKKGELLLTLAKEGNTRSFKEELTQIETQGATHIINEKTLDLRESFLYYLGYSLLHAAQNHQHDIIHAILSNDQHYANVLFITGKSKRGTNALHVAVEGTSIDTFQLILGYYESSTPVSQRHYNEYLYHAILRGQDAQALILIDKVDASDVVNQTRQSALHLAAHENRPVIITALLKKGASVEERDRDNHTPLYYAFTSKSWDAIKCLIEHGANTNLPISKRQYGRNQTIFTWLTARMPELLPNHEAASAHQQLSLFSHNTNSTHHNPSGNENMPSKTLH